MAVVPAADPTSSEKATQTTAPQPQAATVPESDAVLNALQNLVAAESALAQSVNAALPSAAASQGGLAPLLADLVQAQQTQDLPPSVQTAIVDILALRSPLDTEITGADIKAALTNSGLFSEAKAAAGLQETNAGAQIPPAATDIKTALLVLRQSLTTWLSDVAAPPQVPAAAKDAAPESPKTLSNNPAPQTYRGGVISNAPPASQALVLPALPSAMSQETALKTAASGSAPPHVQISSSSEAVTKAPANPAATGAASVVPQPATISSRPQAAPPAPISKTTPPILQQATKASPAAVPAEPNAPAAAKSAALAPSRSPLNNSPPPITRAVPGASPSFAPTPPVPVSPSPASAAPVSSAQVSSAANPQGAPNAPESGTAQPQTQVTPPPQVTNETPQAAAPQPAGDPLPSAPANAGALPGGADLKLALALFQQLLKTSLDDVSALPYAPEAGRNPGPEPRPPAANNPPPPPYRGGPTSAQPPLQSTLPADANPRLVGQVLLNHTEAALAHLKLLQIASLPDSPQGNPHHEDSGPRLMFEIPFSTPQGSAIAQFEIRRDGRGGKTEKSGPVWRARFSLDVEPMGPVHAQIVLMGEQAWVTLWAEREASIQILREKEALLSQALKDSDVVPEVAFCLGAPHRRVAPAGQFLDRAS